jgi:hypothetical protein
MTAQDFIDEVKGMIFPDREALNLATLHSRYIIDGWIWLQKRVPQLQEHHFNLFPAQDTLFRCCTSVLMKPDGVMRKLWTYTQEDMCDFIFYQPVTMEAFLSNWRSALACGTCVTDTTSCDVIIQGDPASLGLKNASELNDKPRRASNGIWTVAEKQIWIYPAIQFNETIGTHWRGVKLDYSPTDPLVVPLDAQRVVELFTKAEVALREGCDTAEFSKLKVMVEQQAGDLTWWYREKDSVPEMEWRGAACEACIISMGTTTTAQPTEEPGPGPGPGPTMFTVYLGNAGPDAPSSYTEAGILSMENGAFGIRSTRSIVTGFYEISETPNSENQYRLVCIPASKATSNVVFTSSGFSMPMNELPQVVVEGVSCRIFRTTVRSPGPFTFAFNSQISIVAV